MKPNGISTLNKQVFVPSHRMCTRTHPPDTHTPSRYMIQTIHWVLSSRQPTGIAQTRSCAGSARVPVKRSFVGLLAWVSWGLACYIGRAIFHQAVLFIQFAEDLLRFLIIIAGIIPFLAISFVFLGVFFHIPRMFATVLCRMIMKQCWKHVSNPTTNHNEGALSRTCQGSCCFMCFTCVFMSSGLFDWSRVVACCTCGKKIVPRC